MVSQSDGRCRRVNKIRGKRRNAVENAKLINVLYRLENRSFRYECINTGVPLMARDMDWTIAMDVSITSSPTSGAASMWRLFSLYSPDLNVFLVSLGKGNETVQDLAYRYISTYKGCLSSAPARYRVVCTHHAGTTTSDLKGRKDSGLPATQTIDGGSFVSSARPLCFGYGTGAFMLPTGTIHQAVVCCEAWTPEQINSFLGL